MTTILKLLTEDSDVQSFEYLVEKTDPNSNGTLFIKGPYMIAEAINKNKRRYPLNELVSEVARYNKDMIKNNRSMGELNHPTSAEVNPERACHMITELYQDGNVFIGKSKILSSPMGTIVRNLISDGVKLGMSSRALGKLIEEGSEVNRVEKMRLVAVDCVADPSAANAFVDGILESKQYILDSTGSIHEKAFEVLEEGLSTLPRKEVENYLKQQILDFLAKIK